MLKLMSMCAAAGAGIAAIASFAAGGQAPGSGPAGGQATTVPATTLKVGDPAPPFELQGSDGKLHKLSDHKGKTVVLAWFPKAFTGG